MLKHEVTVVNELPYAFYDELLTIYYCSDGVMRVSLSKACEALGLDVKEQRLMIERDAVMAGELEFVTVDLNCEGMIHQQSVLCMNMARLPYWLNTLDAHQVKVSCRGSLLDYKRELAGIAWDVFHLELFY